MANGNIKQGTGRYVVLIPIGGSGQPTMVQAFGAIPVRSVQLSVVPNSGAQNPQGWEATDPTFSTLQVLAVGDLVSINASAETTSEYVGAANVVAVSGPAADYAESFAGVAPTATSLQLQDYLPTGQGQLFRNKILVTTGVSVNLSTGLISFPASGSSGSDNYIYAYLKGAPIGGSGGGNAIQTEDGNDLVTEDNQTINYEN